MSKRDEKGPIFAGISYTCVHLCTYRITYLYDPIRITLHHKHFTSISILKIYSNQYILDEKYDMSIRILTHVYIHVSTRSSL